MRVVVTGHLGFIGRHLLNHRDGWQVIGLDVKQDNDIRTCELPSADKVFHLAAQTDARSHDVMADAQHNIIGSLRVFERYHDKVVFASTSMVHYPVTPYAISKRACEEYAKIYGCAVVRLCNIYGPGGHSVIDKFEAADTLPIYGSGEQRREFAHVSAAIRMLLGAQPGGLSVLHGEVLTVREIAERHAKPIKFLPARSFDPVDGVHV